MNVVLNWVKANVYSVVFLLIMIVAPIALTIVAGRMNAGVQQTVKDRATKLSELKQLEKTPFEFDVVGEDPIRTDLLINPQLLDRYRRLAEQIGRDAGATRQAAVEFNRKDRGLLLDRLFPQPQMREVETLPFEMYLAVAAAYDKLLDDSGAGVPPDAQSVREELEAARVRFRTQVLIKSGEEKLNDDDASWLSEQLSKTRLSRYADAAKNIKFFASAVDIGVPDESETPARAEGADLVNLFNWQWAYWVKQDILNAIAYANQSAESVLDAPVKRLVSLTLIDAPVAGAGGGGAAGNAPPAGGGFGMTGGGGGGGGKRRGTSGRGAPAAPAAPSANVSAEARLDYGQSFTGRTTNPLYDVIFVELEIIADTHRIPRLFDALARENFMTITDVKYDAVDPFTEAQAGYYYGGGPVSKLTIELETVWLRQWTAGFMPSALKQSLGIPEAPASNG